MKSILEKLNALILLALLIATVLAVVFRTMIGISASWSEELGQFAFIFLVFIGAAAAMADQSHIAITSFVDRLGPRAQRACRIVQLLLPIPFLLVFAYGAWINVRLNWSVELSTVEWMTVGYMYLVVLLSSVVMIGYLCARLLRELGALPAVQPVRARA